MDNYGHFSAITEKFLIDSFLKLQRNFLWLAITLLSKDKFEKIIFPKNIFSLIVNYP